MAVVATGFFDGVHLGHRLVIDTLLSESRRRGERSVIITFWPHPRTVLQDGARTLRLLTSQEEKTAMLKGMGVDEVVVLPFTREFASLKASDYISRILPEYSCSCLVLGYDTRLGSDLLGPQELASLYPDSIIVPVCTVPSLQGAPAALPSGTSAASPSGAPAASPLGTSAASPSGAPAASPAGTSAPSLAGETVTVSSTRIRQAVTEGDMQTASLMLGRPYSLKGVVVAGNQLGRTIGFPTANMQLYEPLKLVPGRGVYQVEVDTLGRSFQGMTNIGVRPTVSENAVPTIETNIFDFDEMIYGLDIQVRFLRKIRNERKFSSLEDLASQLAADKAICLEAIA